MPQDKTSKKRILIIDDDPDLRNLLKLGMDIAGYETIIAKDGAEAISIVKQDRFDIIIVDLLMPVMDGLRFLNWLRNEAKISVPVLVFTSNASKDIIVEAKAAGAEEVILKPIKLKELLEKLSTLERT